MFVNRTELAEDLDWNGLHLNWIEVRDSDWPLDNWGPGMSCYRIGHDPGLAAIAVDPLDFVTVYCAENQEETLLRDLPILVQRHCSGLMVSLSLVGNEYLGDLLHKVPTQGLSLANMKVVQDQWFLPVTAHMLFLRHPPQTEKQQIVLRHCIHWLA